MASDTNSELIAAELLAALQALLKRIEWAIEIGGSDLLDVDHDPSFVFARQAIQKATARASSGRKVKQS